MTRKIIIEVSTSPVIIGSALPKPQLKVYEEGTFHIDEAIHYTYAGLGYYLKQDAKMKAALEEEAAVAGMKTAMAV